MGEVVRELYRSAPGLRRAGRGRRLHGPDLRGGRTRRRHVIQHPFNLGIGGAVQSGYKYADNDYEYRSRSTGTASTTPMSSRMLSRRWRSRGRHGVRIAVPGRGNATGPRSAAVSGSCCSRSCCRGSSDSASPTRRLAFGWWPARRSAVRAGLPSRLSGGRSPDAPHSPAENARGPGAMNAATAAAPRSRNWRAVYYMVKVLLAISSGCSARGRLEPGDPRRPAGHSI